MSTIAFARSPRYFFYFDATALSMKLIININGVNEYTLIKNFDANDKVLFEYAELVRDYINIDFSTPSSWSAAVILTYKTYSGLNGTGTELFSNTGPLTFLSDGYGYFEADSDFTVDKGLMQSNNIVYRLVDSDVRIPINRNATTRVNYLLNDTVVKTEAITSSATSAFLLIGTNNDSFKDRVLSDDGIYEDSSCIQEFDNTVDLNGVDKITIEASDGLETVTIKTISECKFKPAKVSFVNKFGAIQDVWFFKKSIESLNVTSEKYKSNTIVNGTFSLLKHQKQNFNVEGIKKITLNTGYVDESYNEVMQQVLLSEMVWMEIDSVITPMNVTTNSLTFKTSVNDRLVDYKIDLEYAFDIIQNIR
jgi:hypothetical protein